MRFPMVREGNDFREASWQEAFERINAGLGEVIEHHGPESVAVYIGNPSAHNVGLGMGLGIFAGALGSPHIYSAGSVDQLPKQLASELMFGNGMAIPVPDITGTDYLLMLGANPIVSNGSLWMVPDFRGKLRAMRSRGGRLVTVDPRRTETARLADEHVFIKPGTDAWLLAALAAELHRRGRRIPSSYPIEHADSLFSRLATVTPEMAALMTGIPGETIMDIVGGLDSAANPVVYGRVGTTIQRHGTLTSFLVEVINLLTGSLDHSGGAMFPEQPYRSPASSSNSPNYARYHTRVSGYPEVLGQFPAAALAEEMETPGEGQIRALVCVAGNPVVSNPDSDRLANAIASLDLVVCVDIYHTETSQFADVILPGTSPFEEGHYDHFLGAMGYRNAARYSSPVFASDRADEWRTMLQLGYLTRYRQVATESELDNYEDTVIAGLVAAHCNDPTSPIHGRDIQEIMALIEPTQGVERLLDVGMRVGRFGDHFSGGDGLTLNRVAASPDGIDLGPLREDRLAEVVRRPNGRIDLGPQAILDDLDRLLQEQPDSDSTFRLVGRRNTRSNNSWLRNLPMLGRGRNLCVLEMHPDDAGRLGIGEGDTVQVSTGSAQLRIPVSLTKDILPGIVVMPHGFSQTQGLRQSRLQPGENYNRLVAAAEVDAPSGTSALNGIAVSIVADQHPSQSKRKR
ncbi:MAG: molybdopterin-dependent oxidoreductase [Proteobacteria bacterium]|nr:molybdopterin-dependent oxidoreductase [Pseudomonadota bacterium]